MWTAAAGDEFVVGFIKYQGNAVTPGDFIKLPDGFRRSNGTSGIAGGHDQNGFGLCGYKAFNSRRIGKSSVCLYKRGANSPNAKNIKRHGMVEIIGRLHHDLVTSAAERIIVLHGMTGCGKTTFINGLDHRHCSTIDLEGLACHRGSAFGSLGLGEQPSQKHFDTMLWNALRKTASGKPIILEGESQRIGRITLPGQVYDVMARSSKIWCSASIDTRINRLAQEYARQDYREPMAAALERIRKKLGSIHYYELKTMLDQWDVAGLARGLIQYYYDKLYYKNRSWTPDTEIDLEDFQSAEKALSNYCKTHPQT